MLLALKYYLDQAGIRFVDEEDGQALIEYILIVGIISVAAIAAMQLLGPAISAKFDEVTAALP
jgi:pilus assembly protein Flp/PilA